MRKRPCYGDRVKRFKDLQIKRGTLQKSGGNLVGHNDRRGNGDADIGPGQQPDHGHVVNIRHDARGDAKPGHQAVETCPDRTLIRNNQRLVAQELMQRFSGNPLRRSVNGDLLFSQPVCRKISGQGAVRRICGQDDVQGERFQCFEQD